jgi:molybdopterin molybdotransferase
MLSYEQALEKLLAAAQPVEEIRHVPLLAANGRVLAVAQHSTVAVPPLDNSAMDGYAVRTADLTVAGVSMPVSQRIPAGTVGLPLQPGTAARIFTGAPIPEGADAVVMQELCEHGEGGVVINHVPKSGENVRRAGEDISVGAEILAAGIKLRPQEIALAASAGLPELPVHRRIRVGVFFTGDELVQPGEPLPPGAIYNSNRYALRTLLEGLGCEVRDLGAVADTLEATREAMRRAAADNDLVITSGGVSVGEEDHVKPAVETEGKLDMWKIAIKPGKPLAFGEIQIGRASCRERVS